MAKLELKKAIEINGEMKKEIEYDLEGLTGADIQLAVKDLTKRQIQVLVPEVDSNYHAMVFAVASGLTFEDVGKLGAKDYQKMCSVVRDFFLEE